MTVWKTLSRSDRLSILNKYGIPLELLPTVSSVLIGDTAASDDDMDDLMPHMQAVTEMNDLLQNLTSVELEFEGCPWNLPTAKVLLTDEKRRIRKVLGLPVFSDTEKAEIDEDLKEVGILPELGMKTKIDILLGDVEEVD